MKFSKTFCQPSAVVTLVPAGLLVKLQYNEYGLLQKMSVGMTIDLDPTYDDLDAGDYDHDVLLKKIKDVLPSSIPTKGGTTWIYGVLYTDRIPCDEGVVPQALYKSYIKNILDGGSYTFYAGYVKSLAVSFAGAVAIRNYLSTNHFNTLPQIMVPVTVSDDTVQMLMNQAAYPFKSEYLSGFFIYEDMNCRFSFANLMQINVTNEVKPFVESDGYLKGKVETKSGRTYLFNYSAIVHHGVEKGCSLLVEHNLANNDSTINILATRAGVDSTKVLDNLGREVKCPVCGKLYRVGYDDLPIQCDDPHCLSHSYSDALKMLSAFDLPTLSFNSYKALVDSKKIICLTDLLELPPCKDEEIVSSLANAMYAVVPTSAVPNFDFFEKFANKCNNNVDTCIYYLNNPLRIETDFDITELSVRKFAKWLEDPYNLSTLTTVFSQVTIEKKDQKFDGDPIFRGNTIALTGKFKRGDYEEIKSILMSYAANVVPSIEIGQPLPDVVIMGSLNDGVSGQMIQKANIHSIPVVDEDDFFERYEIDKDLAENLL